MTVSSPTNVGDFHQLGHLKGTVYMCFGGCGLWYPRLLLWKQLNWHSKSAKLCCMTSKVCIY